MLKPILLINFLIISFVAISVAAKPISIFTYHDKAPFVLDKTNKIGIYYDLAKYQNQKQSTYQFSTTYIPRKRLDYIINNKKLDGLVVGVSPLWFQDEAENKFLWLGGIIEDRDEYISLANSPFIYKNQSSLAGKTMIKVAGYYYFGVSELAREGKLNVIETVGELQVLRLLKKQRADFGIVSASSFRYFAKNNYLDPKTYHRSEIPHDEFVRRAFTNKSNEPLFKELESIFATMQQDPVWLKMLNEYR